MKSTRTYLIALLSLLLIGGAAFAWRQYTELTTLRAQLLDNDGDRLRKQLADAQKRLKSLQDQLAAARNRRGSSDDAQPGDGAPDDGPGGPGGRAGRRGGPGGFMSAVMNNPEAQKLLAIQAKAQLDSRYAALFKSLNLTPEQLDQFKSLLVEKQAAVMDALQAARAQGLDPRTDPAGFKAAVTQAQNAVDQQIQQSLGDAGYAQYQQYQQTLPERNTVTQLQTSLSYTQTPLTSDQVDQMIQVLAQTQPQKASNGTTGTGGGGGMNIGALMNGGGTSAVTNDTITLAQSVLTAPQVAALQQIQAQQQAQQQLQALMRQNRQGATPAPTATAAK